MSDESAAAALLAVRTRLVEDSEEIPPARDDLGDGGMAAVALHNIRHDLREAVAALSMLVDRLIRIGQLYEVMFNESVDDAHRGVAMRQHRRASLEGEVLIKSLYSTFYAVEELAAVGDLRGWMGPAIERELDRVCQFRHKLVTHKQERTLVTRQGRLEHPARLELHLSHAPFSISEADVAAVARVYKRVEHALPAEARGLINVHQRMEALYRQLPLLPGCERAEVKTLMGRIGTKSDAPLILARLLEDLWDSFMH